MAANVPEGTYEVQYFSLRRYEPDQVQRVKSQPVYYRHP